MAFDERTPVDGVNYDPSACLYVRRAEHSHIFLYRVAFIYLFLRHSGITVHTPILAVPISCGIPCMGLLYSYVSLLSIGANYLPSNPGCRNMHIVLLLVFSVNPAF